MRWDRSRRWRVACGKKGPPLAPFVRIPAAVEQVEARRVGDDVYVTRDRAAKNIDGSMPVDVARIEVYALHRHAPRRRAAASSRSRTLVAHRLPSPAQHA